MKTPWLCAKRLAWILRVLVRHAMAAQVIPRLRRFAPWLPESQLPGPERLRVLFEDLGGTFLKFGQMLALQPDILEVEYCDALFDLLDRIEAYPFSEAERVCVEELGSKPEEIFDTFDREPLATASVGQVYVATLEGKKVAVKIQRPNIEIEFSNDVRLMVLAMGLIRALRIKRLQWMLRPTREFVSWTREELDYRNEAGHSEELRRHAVDNPAQHVPAVDMRYTTRRTLVVEFLEGVTLIEYLRARAEGDEVRLRRLTPAGFDSVRFAGNVVSNFLGDAFQHGIYHADLHPANLMILENNVVGYLDFGITGLMGRYSRRHLLAMTLALARGDVETMKVEYQKITGREAGADRQALRAGLDSLAEGWYEQRAGQRRLRANITTIFNDILNLSRQTGFLPERDIVKFIRSSIAIDGLMSRFDPQFDLGLHIGESCARFLTWQARQEWVSADRLQDFGSAGGRLLLDGPVRASQWLERLADPGRAAAEAPPAGDAGEDDAVLRRRCRVLALSMVGAAAFFAAAGEPAPVGANLWTALVLFMTAAGLALASSLRRLTF